MLVGVMGAGKSSVVDAICFALYGTFPALSNNSGTRLEDLVTDRPVRQESATVRLRFSIGADAYTVTRSLHRKGASTARLEKNGVYLQAQPKKVTEEITALLKTDYDVFSRAVYANQNNVGYFLDIVKGKRKSEIDHMLGLDSFAAAEENATNVINSMRERIDGELRALEGTNADELGSQVSALERSRERLISELRRLEAEAGERQQQLEKLEGEQAKLRDAYARGNTLSNEIARLASKSSTLKEQLAAIRTADLNVTELETRIAKMTGERSELEKRRLALEERYRALMNEAADAAAMARKLSGDAEEKSRLVAELKSNDAENIATRLAKESGIAKELEKRVAAYEARRRELARQIEELGEPAGICPVCERPMEQHLRDTVMARKKEELDIAAEDLAHSAAALDSAARSVEELAVLERRIREAASAIKKYGDVEQQLELCRVKAGKARARADELYAQVREISSRQQAVAEEVSLLSRHAEELRRAKTYAGQIEELERQIRACAAELASIHVDDRTMNEIEQSIRKVGEARAAIRSGLQGNQSHLVTIEQQLADRRRRIAELESTRARIARERKALEAMAVFKSALRDTQAQLRSRLVEAINDIIGSIWTDLYPYADYHVIRLRAKADDYVLEVRRGDEGSGAWQAIGAVASGGERSMAALAMRIAFAFVVVPNLRWFILDEPTHNIDANGIARMVQAFGGTVSRSVDQVFVITHDEVLKDINGATVYVLERDKASYEPTRVVEQ